MIVLNILELVFKKMLKKFDFENISGRRNIDEIFNEKKDYRKIEKAAEYLKQNPKDEVSIEFSKGEILNFTLL